MIARDAKIWAAMVAGSAAGAALLAYAGFPAALLLGPLVAAIVTAVCGVRLHVPRPAFVGAQALLGCMIAGTIGPRIVGTIAHDWFVMFAIVGSTVLASAAVGYVLARFGTLPGTTAAWGSSPGGASAMVAMSETFGADTRLVAFMQYLRVIVVVLSASFVARLLHASGPAGPATAPMSPVATGPLPLLETLALAGAGLWIAQRLRIPAGPIVVPMVLGAVLHAAGVLTIDVPFALLGVTYAVIGWYVGLQFSRESLVYAVRAVPQLLAATFALIALCALSALLLRIALGTDALTAYLATSPGGLDSVAIIAAGSRADIPFVMAVQALRIFVVILTGPAVAKLVARYAAAGPLPGR